jgi:two-component system, NarL family, response regulator DevR
VVAERLSDGTGARVSERLQAILLGLRCLAWSESVTDEAVHAAVRAGASGYLGKHVPGPVLVDAIRRLASGETVFDPNASHPGRRADARHDRLASLTYRERAVLELIAEGLSNREIGQRMRLAPNTVKNCVT